MWKMMNEGWVWFVAAIDLAISIGLAHLLVRYFDWRCCTMINASLDASGSILGYTVVIGSVFFPIVFFFGGAIVVGIVDSYRMESKKC